MKVLSAESISGDNLNAIYAILPHLHPQVCVDVGAAAGDTARLILKANPSYLHLIEPYPGNWRFLEAALSKHPNTTVYKAAAAAKGGKRGLITTQQVGGQEPGWENKVGYSSVSRFTKGQEVGALEVDCIVIDEAIPEDISFLKIDVQGAEREVLDGCRKHFERGGVDLCFVEYAGEPDLIPFFEEFGFTVFWTPLMAVSRLGGVVEKLPQARPVSVKPLSTGSVGECFWDDGLPAMSGQLPVYFRELRKYCQHVQTDLICVSPNVTETFQSAVAAYRASIA